MSVCACVYVCVCACVRVHVRVCVCVYLPTCVNLCNVQVVLAKKCWKIHSISPIVSLTWFPSYICTSPRKWEEEQEGSGGDCDGGGDKEFGEREGKTDTPERHPESFVSTRRSTPLLRGE